MDWKYLKNRRYTKHTFLSLFRKQCSTAAVYTVFTMYWALHLSRDDSMWKDGLYVNVMPLQKIDLSIHKLVTAESPPTSLYKYWGIL